MGVLNESEIREKLQGFEGWIYDNNQIKKEFLLKDFKSALHFVNKTGDEAEAMDHHPDIFIHNWNKVTITLSTHSEGGVTEKDFTLADKIENLIK